MNAESSFVPSRWELLGFVAVALIGVFFGAVVFYRVLGVVGAIWALSQMRSREIPVGVEGHPATFHIRGVAAVLVSLALATIFGAMAWFAPQVACFLSDGQACS